MNSRDEYLQYADYAASEDDRSLEELLADASNAQLRTALEYLYAQVTEAKKEQAREYLTE